MRPLRAGARNVLAASAALVVIAGLTSRCGRPSRVGDAGSRGDAQDRAGRVAPPVGEAGRVPASSADAGERATSVRKPLPPRAEIEKLPPDGGPEFNRLVHESSPYLLQHARNPVDWYPWGEEAFEKARRDGKPIFLSIGYSTCHWCHVMEHESFESDAIATYMNEHFVPIKVDREERPDVDAVYMDAVQAMTGSGGWPLSVWLTPEREPFFGGTYFPPDDRFGRSGFLTVLRRLEEVWRTRRDDARSTARSLVSQLADRTGGSGTAPLDRDLLARAVRDFASTFDSGSGGFNSAPKFPRAFALSFLLAQSARGDTHALRMVEKTLDEMGRGGIHDHLGGGFHRYSTDAVWRVPHFEKMLYDQAMLARAYVEAWRITGKAEYGSTARDTFDFVLRELLDPSGAFQSAQDADSEGEEGRYYVWTLSEVVSVLGEEDGRLFAEVYGVEPGGNMPPDPHLGDTDRNVLHLARPIDDEASARGIPPAALRARLAASRERLLEVRRARVPPHTDDKVLADWNGLMIGALAHGGATLSEPRYVEAAVRAADAVLGRMRRDGALLHRMRGDVVGIPGFLDDHAFLGEGLFDLYQATLDARWLEESNWLAREMLARFRDPAGGFRLAPSDADPVVRRTKELYDGAMPSGNSSAMQLLQRLGHATGDQDLLDAGRETLEYWSGTIARAPTAYPYALLAVDVAVGPAQEIVIAGAPGDAATEALVAEVRRRFLPRSVLVLHPIGDAGRAIEDLAPFTAPQGLVDGHPAAYVCTDFACKLPVTDPGELAKILDAP